MKRRRWRKHFTDTGRRVFWDIRDGALDRLPFAPGTETDADPHKGRIDIRHNGHTYRVTIKEKR